MKKRPHTQALGRLVAVSLVQFGCIVAAVLLILWAIGQAVSAL
jgi:hypothetical protein